MSKWLNKKIKFGLSIGHFEEWSFYYDYFNIKNEMKWTESINYFVLASTRLRWGLLLPLSLFQPLLENCCQSKHLKLLSSRWLPSKVLIPIVLVTLNDSFKTSWKTIVSLEHRSHIFSINLRHGLTLPNVDEVIKQRDRQWAGHPERQTKRK